jgi:hypothetical protein
MGLFHPLVPAKAGTQLYFNVRALDPDSPLRGNNWKVGAPGLLLNTRRALRARLEVTA